MSPGENFHVQDSQAARATPPTTPRARPAARGRGAHTPPPPLGRARGRGAHTPPPPPGRAPRAGPLLRGLKRDCLEQVRLVLEADPAAAEVPIMEGMEDRFDWPLCAAIRLWCSEEIVRLLTENGAKVDVADASGQSPLQLLSSGTPLRVIRGPPEALAQWELGVATALLTAGADPEASRGDLGGRHCSSLELARRAGKDHLVGLYESRGDWLTA